MSSHRFGPDKARTVYARHVRLRQALQNDHELLLARAVGALEVPGPSPSEKRSKLSRLFGQKDKPKKQNLIVVLGVPVNLDGSVGPALQARIDRAVQAAQADPDATIVVTGAAVQNRFYEAEAMRDGMVRAGVASQRITLEPNATTTVGNGAHVWQLVSDGNIGQGRPLEKVTIVAEPYHAMRSLRIFAAAMSDDSSRPVLRLAAAARWSPVGVIKPEPRLAFGRSPNEHGVFLGVLSRCIEERRRMFVSW